MIGQIRNAGLGSIRLVERRDLAGLIDLIVAIELFQADEVEELRTMIHAYLDTEGTREFWIVDDDPQLGLSGVVYCASEQMTHGTWNMYLIGVHKERRRQGRGRTLLRRTEAMLLERACRILIVETSAMNSFYDTRAFYVKCGYVEEARIRDFYNAGDDKVVFWKSLQAGNTKPMDLERET